MSASATWPDSPAGGSLGDGRFALATDRPQDVEALCQAVQERVADGLAIYPQGGRTAIEYGGIPRRPGVAMDVTAINRLIDYPAADMTITVQAGMTLSALRAILAEQHQRVLVDAPQPDRATVGGIYATNTSGPRRYGSGRPRDQIIGVSFVTSSGVVIKGGGRVVKNVAGYDFPKLLTGSLGTLGIMTQLTLKVRPIPEASAVAWVPFSALKSLSTALDELNTSGTRPIALELLNEPAARTVGRSPDLPVDSGVLVIGFEDNLGSIAWQLDRIKLELGRSDLAIIEGSAAAPLWEALTEFQAIEIGPYSLVANVRPSAVVAFIERLDPQRWSIQAHAGNGMIRAHALGERDLATAADEVEQLRKAAVENGGNLIVSRCPTEWKDRLGVWGEPRADWSIAERVKAALDPHGALNPGRFVGRI